MKYKNKIQKKKGKKFRSKLEAYCWEALTKAEIPFLYEPVRLQLVPDFEYPEESYERIGKVFKQQRIKVQDIEYIPDFTPIYNELSDITWIIETKGMLTPVSRLKWKLFKKWLLDNGYRWKLYMPTNQKQVLWTINQIQQLI